MRTITHSSVTGLRQSLSTVSLAHSVWAYLVRMSMNCGESSNTQVFVGSSDVQTEPHRVNANHIKHNRTNASTILMVIVYMTAGG